MTEKLSKKKEPETSAIWGGRFDAGPSQLMEAINASVDFDCRLFAQDITASSAHCAMLVKQGIITKADGEAILDGLEIILREIETGQFTFKRSLEDVHMNIESRLAELIGDAAGRLHTARSRNDQVATDLKLWLRDALDGLEQGFRGLQGALIGVAEKHAGTVMPGLTHLQAAQPVTLGHHLLAYVEMFGRDRGRIADCRKRLNECPLGAAALAGTSFPIDREMTAAALGFDGPQANSLDAVADRDFALEHLSLCAIAAVHMSRLAGEIVLWCSDGFGYMRLSDSFSTGSSIMPQKRNPDAAELVRAKAGRIIGALTGLAVVLKGLPLAYGKDLQEDKEAVFDATDSLSLCIAAMTGMIKEARFDKQAMKAAAEKGHPTATDLADWLVRVLGMPFRGAHHVTGRLVRLADKKKCGLADLPLAEMRNLEPGITKDVFNVLGVASALAGRTSAGGTAPALVARAAKEARKKYLG